MSNNSSNSNNNNNKEMKSRLKNFKNEVASSMNVNLNPGYNGDITSREAGSIGGEMVKRMVSYAENNMNSSNNSNNNGNNSNSGNMMK